MKRWHKPGTVSLRSPAHSGPPRNSLTALRLDLAAPYAGRWVLLDLRALESFAALAAGPLPMRDAIAALGPAIKEWNLADKDGQPLPCGTAGLCRLGLPAFQALMAAMAAATAKYRKEAIRNGR